jgi:hypothetical protein
MENAWTEQCASVLAAMDKWIGENPDAVADEDDMAADEAIGRIAGANTPVSTSRLIALLAANERLADEEPDLAKLGYPFTPFRVIAVVIREALQDVLWGHWENAKITAASKIHPGPACQCNSCSYLRKIAEEAYEKYGPLDIK